MADPSAICDDGTEPESERLSARAGRLNSTRRQALFGGLCLCCLPRLGRAAESFALDEVGPGTFVRRGLLAEAEPGNDDAIANTGFIVGREAVLVTEAGGSQADGAWLRAEIRKRTDKPISYVVMSHVHPDHVFGACAFEEDKPDFVGHRSLRGALDGRGEYYRKRLADLLGPERAGRVVYPTMEVGEGAEIDLGDRTIRLTAHATAHTNCDLSMLDTGSGLLFPADLLSVGRIPSLDGSLKGWLKAVEALRALGAEHAVPGHGPTRVAFAPAMDDLARFLTTLRDETRKAIADGIALEKAVRTVGQSERERWGLFDEYIRRDVTQAYQELEWE